MKIQNLKALMTLIFFVHNTQPLDAATIKVKKTIVVKGKSFDGKGNTYVWTGKGNCGQAEGMAPMFKLETGAKLKNLSMKNAPDGIHIYGSNVTIENITNLDVCEDAVSFRGSTIKKAIIRNNKFFKCADKGISTPRGSDILIEGNEFHECDKAIRLHNNHKNVRVIGNKFYKVGSGIQIDEGGEILIKDNYIENSKNLVYAYDGAHVINQGGNVEGPNVRSIYRIEDGASMENEVP